MWELSVSDQLPRGFRRRFQLSQIEATLSTADSGLFVCLFVCFNPALLPHEYLRQPMTGQVLRPLTKPEIRWVGGTGLGMFRGGRGTHLAFAPRRRDFSASLLPQTVPEELQNGRGFGYVVAFRPHGTAVWMLTVLASADACRYVYRNESVRPFSPFEVRVGVYNNRGEGPFSTTAVVYSAEEGRGPAARTRDSSAFAGVIDFRADSVWYRTRKSRAYCDLRGVRCKKWGSSTTSGLSE